MIIFSIISILTSLWYLSAVMILRKGLDNLKRQKIKKRNKSFTYSIIIAARNEEKNIRQCLVSVFSQNLDKNLYEVIVVDDRSTDSTYQILKEYEDKFPNLTVISVKERPSKISPKKFAISQALKVAKNEIVVFTDADCIVPSEWLSTIGNYFTEDVGLVQGMTSFLKLDKINTILFDFQSLDFISHGIVAAGAIGANFPINSNGNNLAVRRDILNSKTVFDGNKGNVVLGDDDLLLQEIWKSKRWKVVFMDALSGAVKTMPVLKTSELLSQRTRWSSVTIHYNFTQVIFLSGVFLFYLAIFSLLFLSPLNKTFFYLFIILFFVKIIGELILLIPGLRMFNKRELIKTYPFATILHLPMVILAVFGGVFGKFKWKDQKFASQIR